MGAKTELFPTFSELCAIAREVEKKPFSIPPRPIDGKLVLDENFGIFPREFEEYTYSFLLSEAQKIERRLSADAISSSQQESVFAPRHLTPEQQMQNDLYKFVSAQEQARPDNGDDRLLQSLREKKVPLPPVPSEVADFERENHGSRDSADGDDVPVPEEDGAPSQPVRARGEPRPGAQLPEKKAPPRAPATLPDVQAKARILPPKAPSSTGQGKPPSLPGAPQIPTASHPMQPAPQAPAAKPAWQAAPKPPAQPAPQAPAAKPAWQAAPKPQLQATESKPAEQDDAFEPLPPIPPNYSPSNAPEPPSGAEKKAQAGISSYSKLSPRLRALIEQKLRREEEKVKKAREDSDIFKTPPPAPPDEESGADGPGQELENMDAPNAWNVHDEEAAADDVPSARDKGRKTPPSGPDENERGEKAPDLPSETEREETLPSPAGKSPPKTPLRMAEDGAALVPGNEEGLMLPDGDELPAPRKPASPMVAREEESEGETPSPDVEEQASLKEPVAKPVARKEIPAILREDENERQVPPPAAQNKEDAQVPGARREAQSGPIMIKPRFPDAAASGSSPEKQEISQAEDSDRMRRIQRIIEELSPDKMRVQPKQDDFSLERQDASQTPRLGQPADSGDDEVEKEPEQSAPAPRAAASGKKSKAPSVPLKKDAGAQKKKTAAVQEKEGPSAALRSKAAPIGADAQNASQFAPDAAKGDDYGSDMEAGQKAAPAKKLQIKAQAEDLPEGEAEEIPSAKAAVSRPAARKEEILAASRLPVSQSEKMRPQLRPPAESGDEEMQAPAQPKLRPRIVQAEEQEEEIAPARPLRKLMPRIPLREDEGEEEPPPVQVPALRRRILPGMGRTEPSTPQTYVPPARERRQIAPPAGEPEERETQAAEPEANPVRIAPLKPRKLVSDESVVAADKTPEQLLQDQKMARMAEQLARLEAGKVKEVAGTAVLPADEEDIPLPGIDDGVPKPAEYGQAKENLRKALEHEETVRKVKQEDEVIVEQYAKDHLVWLYEIYKMGGMGREDFLQKASEKYSAAQNAGPAAGPGVDAGAPPNPALANLSKEIEKKDKK